MSEGDLKQPLPSYGAIDKYLGDEGEKYFRQQNTSGNAIAHYNKFLFSPFVKNTDEVLDFGCGGGNLLNVLNPKIKVGVEINPTARAYATRLGIEIYSTLDELEHRAFDKIITSHALEHIPNPYEALVKLKGLLKPDGLLLWLAPIDDWRNKTQKMWSLNDNDMHLYTWTPLLLGNLLKTAGFVPQSVTTIVHACPPSPFDEWLWKTHPSLFHIAAYIWARVRKQRQLFAVATGQ
ncbi:MAG: class I SAM-dependent methyltransferase [Acidobacteriota bacterium]